MPSRKEKSARSRNKNRSTLGSAAGPPSWKSVPAKHREVLNIPGTPLEKPRGWYSKWKSTSMRVCDIFSEALGVSR